MATSSNNLPLELTTNNTGNSFQTSWRSFNDLSIEIVYEIFSKIFDSGSLKPRQVCKAWLHTFNTLITNKLTKLALPTPGPLKFADVINSIRRTVNAVSTTPQIYILRTLNTFATIASGRELGTKQKLLTATRSDLEKLQGETSTALLEVWPRITPHLNFGTNPVPQTAEEIYAWLTNPNNVPQLEEIISLDLSNLSIKLLPPCVFQKMKNLLTLNLTNTPLTEISAQISTLTKLRGLELANTAIKELPQSLFTLKNLISLNVNGTKISELPIFLARLPLETLTANDCSKLTKISPELIQKKNITLSYSNTPIAAISRRTSVTTYCNIYQQ